jgi:3-methylcrotonyl-CoA carboxylase alpha subunit
VVFIGPPASAIKAMGLKAESKQLMEKAGVPLVPGYHGASQDEALLQKEADRIGYPALIKASAGGGGKGMRIVEKSEDFAAALASCKREAINSFGDDAVLIEKYVQKPRHIEIQVFGDTRGNYVYLFERDCSVQRRHQKVLEEAPAPGMPVELREAMGKAAVEAARAVNYCGAGTVEFIVEQQGGYDQPEKMKFYFMEMNTRLQVEHPVTEAITGQDLVEWQLRVASGEPLPCKQADLKMRGHAIEARICAENPDKGFLPATGCLSVYRKPAHSAFEYSSVRIDDGVREGDAISPYYDSMIAKLIVHGSTRQEALAKLDAALAQMHIVGLHTNVQFLRHVVATPSFAQAKLDTALISREEKLLFNQEKLPLATVVSSYVASVLAVEKAQAGGSAFAAADGWQAYGSGTRRFAFEWREQAAHAVLTYLHDGALSLDVQSADAQHTGLLSYEATAQGLRIQYAGQSWKASVDDEKHEKGAAAFVFTAQGATKIIVINPFFQLLESNAGGGRLSAPMPGKLVAYSVKAGDPVKAGQQLAVMEAMKMEHSIAAPKDGIVSELLFNPGDQVAEGAQLLSLAA